MNAWVGVKYIADWGVVQWVSVLCPGVLIFQQVWDRESALLQWSMAVQRFLLSCLLVIEGFACYSTSNILLTILHPSQFFPVRLSMALSRSLMIAVEVLCSRSFILLVIIL